MNFRSLLSGKMKVSKVPSLWIVLVGSCRRINAFGIESGSTTTQGLRDVQTITVIKRVESETVDCGKCLGIEVILENVPCAHDRRSQYADIDCGSGCEDVSAASDCTTYFNCNNLPADNQHIVPFTSYDTALVHQCTQAKLQRASDIRGEKTKMHKCRDDAFLEGFQIASRGGVLDVASNDNQLKINSNDNKVDYLGSELGRLQSEYSRYQTLDQCMTRQKGEFLLHFRSWCDNEVLKFDSTENDRIGEHTSAINKYKIDMLGSVVKLQTDLQKANAKAKGVVETNAQQTFDNVETACEEELDTAKEDFITADTLNKLLLARRKAHFDKEAERTQKKTEGALKALLTVLCAEYKTYLKQSETERNNYLSAKAKKLNSFTADWNAGKLKEYCEGSIEEAVEDVNER